MRALTEDFLALEVIDGFPQVLKTLYPLELGLNLPIHHKRVASQI